jgi:DNA-directed RNA polymerase specialized sigma24 family protein
MLTPEATLPDTLERAEVEAELARLVQNPAEIARAKKFAKVLAHGLRQLTGDDLLHEAITRLLCRSRKWRRGLPVLVVLTGTMRSIAFSARKAPDYGLAEDIGATSDEDSDDDPSPLGEGTSPETDPGRIVEAESEISAVQIAVQGDEELELLVEAFAEGLRGQDAAQELGWDRKTYDAARKRLSRRLAALDTDGRRS